MKLYKITATGTPDSETPDSETHWVGTQADAASKRKKLLTDGYKRANIDTDEVDVPTDKAGLLKFLNTGCK